MAQKNMFLDAPDAIEDVTVTSYLKEAREGKPDAPVQLFDYLIEQVNYQKQFIFPASSPAASPPAPSAAGESGDATPPDEGAHAGGAKAKTMRQKFNDQDREWGKIWDNVVYAAYHLWRDSIKVDSTKKAVQLDAQMRLEILYASSLLFLGLRIKLYGMRLRANYQNEYGATEGDLIAYTPSAIKELIDAYRAALRQSNRELNSNLERSHRGNYFSSLSAVQNIRSLIREFGPDTLDDREVGWALHTTAAKNQLRYLYFNARRDEYFRHLRRWPAAIWYLVLGVTTGYGVRPGRFLATVVLTLVFFVLSYRVTDQLGSPVCYAANTSGLNAWEVSLRYIYTAATNLTSLGSSLAQPCLNRWSEALLTLESFAGYFLLATGASLFIEQMRESEQ